MLSIDDNDDLLVKAYLNGKETALDLLIKKHKRRIFSYIIVNIKDSMLAEDIFQDTFIKVINTLKAGRYTEEGKFLPWVLRITHNLIIDHYRAAKKMRCDSVISNNEESDIFSSIKHYTENAEEKIINDQTHKELRRLVEFLPIEQKEVLILRHYVNMSFKDIAEKTGVSINTALGRMRYALINLRKMIKEESTIY